MAEKYEYDVYLSHAESDSSAAEFLADVFSKQGIKTWHQGMVRSWEMLVEAQQSALRKCRMALVLIGQDGVIGDHYKEVGFIAERMFVDSGQAFRAIPVRLPKWSSNGIPDFIKNLEGIWFEESLNPDSRPMKKLLDDVKSFLGSQRDTNPQPDPPTTPDPLEQQSPEVMITLEQFLETDNFKRLRPDERRALIVAGGYCVSKRNRAPLTSSLFMFAVLMGKTRSPNGQTEKAFLDAIEKQLRDKGRFSTTGNYLNLPSDFVEFIRSTKERDVDQKQVIVASELVTTLNIAALVATETKSEEIHTRHVLGAILSKGHAELIEDSFKDRFWYPDVAIARLLKLDIDIDRLRRDFVTYLRKLEDVNDSGEPYLTWLRYVSVEPPSELLDELLSTDLIVIERDPSESGDIVIAKAQAYVEQQNIPLRERYFVLVSGPDSPNHTESVARLLLATSLVGPPMFVLTSNSRRIKLEFPIGERFVSQRLVELGLIEQYIELKTVYEAPNARSRNRAQAIWRSLLILNPEHVETLQNVLSEKVEALPSEAPDKKDRSVSQATRSQEGMDVSRERSGADENVGRNKKPKAKGGRKPADGKEAITSTNEVVEKVDGPSASETDKPTSVSSTQTPTNGGAGSQTTTPTPDPAKTAATTIIQYITNDVPEPTPDKDRISIYLAGNGVLLWYEDQPYESTNLIPADLTPKTTSPEDYGIALFEGIIHGEHANSTKKGYEKAKTTSRKLTIELWISQENSALSAHRFEYLCDPTDKALPLSTREKIPFYRRFHNTQLKSVKAEPLKILAAICNPLTLGTNENKNLTSLVKLDALQEIAILKNAFQRLEKAGLAQFEILGEKGEAVTLELIANRLDEGFHVLHLLGHGVLIGSNYSLVMEDKDRRHKFESAERFRTTLKGRDLRLVVLAACQSASQGTGVSLQGLGPSIVGDEIPSVIAMQDEVGIATAQRFTQHFYDDLARSGRVDMAMSATRRAIFMSAPKEWQWGIPVLFMSTDEGSLFNVDAQVAKNLPQLQPDIKSYDQLPGLGDPAPQKSAKAIESEARNQGITEDTLKMIRGLMGAELINPRPAPESLAKPQDRDALTQALPNQVRLDPKDLEDFVKNEGVKLELEPVVFRHIASALNAGKHVILIGPPGTGKTSLAHAVCRHAERVQCANGFIPTTATADWTAFDTIGGYVPTAQQVLQFKPGKFLDAVSTGKWLVIDEINRAEIDKAFGELFTVLSGQQADLPYTVGQDQVRILPAASANPQDWIPKKGAGLSGYDFVVHPTWRVIATMNVYDKSSLFGMSFAFMRRFAFIDVDLPELATFESLLDRWSKEQQLDLQDTKVLAMLKTFVEILKPGSPLSSRALGPAIVRDMMWYLGDRVGAGNDPTESLVEAFLLYVTPQLDGLDRSAITAIYRHLESNIFKETKSCDSLLKRLRSLYPHVSSAEWGGQTSL